MPKKVVDNKVVKNKVVVATTKEVDDSKVVKNKVVKNKVVKNKVVKNKVVKNKVVKKKVVKKKKVESKEDKIVLNPLKHIYVPKHEIVSEKEKEELMKRYNATDHQFPQILLSDPVIREIGAKPGDMVKVSRVSQTAGVSEYYRYVVM
jgi:DNA-directed RNA polymerase subunit H